MVLKTDHIPRSPVVVVRVTTGSREDSSKVNSHHNPLKWATGSPWTSVETDYCCVVTWLCDHSKHCDISLQENINGKRDGKCVLSKSNSTLQLCLYRGSLGESLGTRLLHPHIDELEVCPGVALITGVL